MMEPNMYVEALRAVYITANAKSSDFRIIQTWVIRL